MKSHKYAFSLIELSIIMTIIATIAAGLIHTGSSTITESKQKIEETYTKMVEIDRAIKFFINTYGRVPCPAKREIPFGETSLVAYNSYNYNFAFDDEQMANTINSAVNANGAECLSNSGAVPTKILNLPPDYMLDSWGNKFNLHVDPLLCGQNSSATKTCTPSTYNQTPSLSLYDNESGQALTSKGVYVLISYGPNKYGAYNKSGQYTGLSPNITEQSNDAYNRSNFSTDYYKGKLTSIFDDMAIYSTKNQIESSKYLPGNFAVSSIDCTANSTSLPLITNGTLANIRTQMGNITRKSIGPWSSASFYNYSDEAVLDLMWVLQEACYEMRGTTKLCPIAMKYNAETNSCVLCPGTTTYSYATNTCI